MSGPSSSHSAALTKGRRGFFIGAAAAGAGAGLATMLPASPVTTSPVAQALPKAPDGGGGYHLSAHVKHYYQTTMI